jgi:hypothetical protein
MILGNLIAKRKPKLGHLPGYVEVLTSMIKSWLVYERDKILFLKMQHRIFCRAH